MPDDRYNLGPEHSMKNNIRLKIGITLFLVLLFSFFYFMRNPWSANSRTRMALALSLLEHGTVNINKYEQLTIDKAFYNGNYYADKAPGYTFTALPAVWAGYKIFRIVCADWGWSESKSGFIKTACSDNKLVTKSKSNAVSIHALGDNIETDIATNAFYVVQLIGTYFASGLVSALTALVLYFFVLRIGASTGGAVFAAATYGLASLAWVWSTAFHGHVLTGACLFIAFASLYSLNTMKESSPGKEITLALISGALLSWAVVVEYPAAIASVIIAIYGLSKIGKWEKGKVVRTLTCAFTAAIVFILPLLIYNYAAFDSPFSTGYEYVTKVGIFTGMDEGFHGLTYPHPERLYGILFGEIHGLFWFSPILLLTPIALYRYWRTPSSKGEVITITALAVYYILWNSSYFYWHGGQATGPRHIVPMLPFICLPFALLWTRAGAWLKWGLVSLFTLSFFISLISISVRTPGLVEGHNVLFEAFIPRFFEGNIPQVNILRVYIGLLEMSGPEMLLTLIPLFLALILGALYIRKLLGQEELSAP